MITTISAVYERGVLRPVAPLDLPDGAVVELRVVSQAPARPASTAAWRARLADFWRELDAVAQEIGALWPAGVSALQAVREGRREL